MPRFAESTTVPVETSRAEIERILSRYGATSFAYAWTQEVASIQFDASGRRIRFVLPLPDRHAQEFTHTPAKGLRRSPEEQHKAWEQATRQRWRALTLAIKAKLEAVESGIGQFESEFMAYVVLPNGQTVGEVLRPQIAAAYESGTMPKLLGFEAP